MPGFPPKNNGALTRVNTMPTVVAVALNVSHLLGRFAKQERHGSAMIMKTDCAFWSTDTVATEASSHPRFDKYVPRTELRIAPSNIQNHMLRGISFILSMDKSWRRKNVEVINPTVWEAHTMLHVLKTVGFELLRSLKMETFNANKPTAPTRNNHPGTFIVRECIDQLPSIHVRNTETPPQFTTKGFGKWQCQKSSKIELAKLEGL
jgi:hypothetical protein